MRQFSGIYIIPLICLFDYIRKQAPHLQWLSFFSEEVKPWSLLAHSCRRLSRFLQHEAARRISTPPGRDAGPSQVTRPQFVRLPQQFAGTHLYFWVERGTVRGTGRCGGLLVSALVPGASGPSSSPGRGHCVVFLGIFLRGFCFSSWLLTFCFISTGICQEIFVNL